MGQIVPTAGALLYVAKDTERVAVIRRGRYSLERACAESPRHLEQAVRQAWSLMQQGLASLGYEPTGAGPEWGGWQPHVAFSADATPDQPAPRPDPRDLDGLLRWEQAERARVARKASTESDLVDFILKGQFTRQVPQGTRPGQVTSTHRVHIPERR